MYSADSLKSKDQDSGGDAKVEIASKKGIDQLLEIEKEVSGSSLSGMEKFSILSNIAVFSIAITATALTKALNPDAPDGTSTEEHLKATLELMEVRLRSAVVSATTVAEKASAPTKH